MNTLMNSESGGTNRKLCGKGKQGKYRVLFVDDDPTIEFVLRRYLVWDEAGFVLTGYAENGKMALEMLETEKPDLIITDIRMPLIDGLELVRRLRKKGDRTCVLLASTYSDFQYAKEGIRLGALDYIEKPFTPEKLLEGLMLARQYLEEHKKEETGTGLQNMIFAEARKMQLEEMLLERNQEVTSCMKELISQGKESYPHKKEELEEAVETILSSMWKELQKRFAWLGAVEKLDLSLGQGMLEEHTVSVMNYLLQIVERYELDRPSSVIPRVCNYLEDHIEEEQLIEKASLEAELSRDYLGRIFKRRMGISLSEFITILKMDRAGKMLRETNMKIYEISDRLGYANADYFSRLFSSYMGETPARYRKK